MAENELMQVIETSQLEKQTGDYIKEKFLPFFEQAQEWKSKAETLVVTSVTQTREMQMARQARLALRDIRINADKIRKELKEDSLRYGKAVQGVYNVIEYLIAPIEKHLEEQEKFAEIQDAKRRAELKANREMELQPYAEFVPMGIDFGLMTDIDWIKFLHGIKLQYQAKVDEEARIEAERIAKEKAEADERERIKKENERLKKEAEEKEKQLQAERAKAEAERKAAEEKARIEREKAEAERKAIEEKARKEREAADAEAKRIKAEQDAKIESERKAREKAEAELKVRKVEEERIAREKAAEEQKAKAAPDKAKLQTLISQIQTMPLPECSTEQAKHIISDVQVLLGKTCQFIQEKLTNL